MSGIARPWPLAAPQRRARLRAWLQSGGVVRLLSVLATLAVWELYGRQVDPIFLSYPTAIVAAVPAMLANGELARAASSSLRSLALGFGAAIVCGMLVGMLMGRYRLVDRLLDVQVSALYATPNVALIPLIMLWFGLGMTAKVVIIFLSAFFPIVVNTHSGVRNVGRSLVEIGLAEAASERQILAKIILPAALPFIMTGIRLAVGRAVVGMVVAEMFTAVSGLGGAIVTYGNAFATNKLFVVIILLALLGVGLAEFVRALERRLVAWKETERAS